MNALRYPWKAYVRRGALRAEDRWALKVADDFYDRVLGTKGELNGMQQLVAENGQVSRVAIALIFQDIARHGWTRESDNGLELTPAAKDLPKYLTSELKALRELGLESKEKDAGDLALIIQQSQRERDQEESDERHRDGP